MKLNKKALGFTIGLMTLAFGWGFLNTRFDLFWVNFSFIMLSFSYVIYNVFTAYFEMESVSKKIRKE